MPLFGHAEPGPDVVADPVPSVARAPAGEIVEADFEPVGEAVGDLVRFMQRVVGGADAVFEGLAPVEGEVRMELEHGAARLDRLGAVDLAFVVVLRRERGDQRAAGETEQGECSHATSYAAAAGHVVDV